MNDDMAIVTKITKITSNSVVVKARVTLSNGNTYEAYGTSEINRNISGAVEDAEDNAVDRAKRLAGIINE